MNINNKFPTLVTIGADDLSESSWTLVHTCVGSLQTLKVFNKSDTTILLGWGVGEADPTEASDFCPSATDGVGFLESYDDKFLGHSGAFFQSEPIKLYAMLEAATASEDLVYIRVLEA